MEEIAEKSAMGCDGLGERVADLGFSALASRSREDSGESCHPRLRDRTRSLLLERRE